VADLLNVIGPRTIPDPTLDSAQSKEKPSA